MQDLDSLVIMILFVPVVQTVGAVPIFLSHKALIIRLCFEASTDAMIHPYNQVPRTPNSVALYEIGCVIKDSNAILLDGWLKIVYICAQMNSRYPLKYTATETSDSL